ncbi:MAG: SPOR domain-containing protein [Bacteroidaceae bacterium]|nr:SPOR domain-containing protein [Bacteroidaceae bacterium]MBQ2460137.1 SPOR domain-containing protein [Bacteroidaceae bacterium]MBQ2518883.1 SPOR domain-containing protein [Bacteroidaceae bacterium]MBQ2596252.1 SPOR domain-containing protein [Bacteroidaceae bacterium]MBQ3958323.1 SPOR domain-containing protein [Bacteroidaceae bacterium]
MKKILIFGAAVCAVFAMSSCHSKESAYKKAYEKAQAQQTQVAATTATTVQPTQPVTQVTTVTPTTPVNDYSNVSVRTENFSLVSGAPLKAYSVVIGSFGVKANATRLSETLAAKGYTPRVLQASTTNGTMYRVVATSYDSKADAAQSRNNLEAQYPGAWLLYQK